MSLVLATTLLLLLAAVISIGVGTPVRADTGCPSTLRPSGSGNLASPFLISEPRELQYLRENSAIWNSTFRLTSNVDMGGCVWSGGIGANVGSGFGGVFDGAGHVISGLSISSSDQKVGLFAYVAAGSVRNLGFTGSVTAVATGVGDAMSSVGALAGSVASSATIEGVYTTGAVSANLTVSETCMMGCSAVASVNVGGLVGLWDGGTLTRSFATGNATAVAMTSSTQPAYLSAQALAGGLIGYVRASSVSLSESYSTGTPSATAVAPGGSSNAGTGGVTADSGSAFTRTYWNTTTSNTTTGIPSGSYTASVTGLTSTQMRTAGSFTGWNVATGYNAARNWSMCSTVNNGFPFLSVFYATNPCSTTPMVSSLTPTTGSSTGGTSVVITGTDLTGATAVTFAGVNATSYTVDSSTQITAVTPAGNPGAQVDVVVTTPGGSATSTGGFVYDRLTQTVTWAPTTAVLTTQSPLTPSTSATALGGATITYAVQSGFTTTTCTVDTNTGMLTYTGTGTCTVAAIAARTSTYNAGLRNVTFTVSAPASNGGSGGSSSGNTVASQAGPQPAPVSTPQAQVVDHGATKAVVARADLIRRIYFAVSSSSLTDAMKSRLRALVRSARDGSPATVTVGVVRASGATSDDQAIALARARTVTAFLRSAGMPGTVRVGASIPTTLRTWQARRVDVTVKFQ